jgi:hypothetical protein
MRQPKPEDRRCEPDRYYSPGTVRRLVEHYHVLASGRVPRDCDDWRTQAGYNQRTFEYPKARALEIKADLDNARDAACTVDQWRVVKCVSEGYPLRDIAARFGIGDIETQWRRSTRAMSRWLGYEDP